MRRSAAVLIVLVVAALTACGSDDSGGSSTSDKPATTNAQATTPAAAPSAETTKTTAAAPTTGQNTAVVTKCHQMFDPLQAKLRKIQSNVDGSPTFKTYSAAVGDLVADFTGLDASKIPSESCLTSVSVTTTGAYLRHFTATNDWTACRKSDSCKAAMPAIEAKWEEASKLLATARKGYSDVTAS